MHSDKGKIRAEVIGRGNVGTTLARIFGVCPVSSRTLEGLNKDADLYIIAVSDTAVEDVASRLPKLDGVVVHTTGSVGIEALKATTSAGYGVLYPFQTISKQRELEARDIPLLIEACDQATEELIIRAAEAFGFDKIQRANSEKRRLIHLAGVFANNFCNAMIGISQRILESNGIDKSIINPLIAETIEKVSNMNADEAQTGPAARNDRNTIRTHRNMLKNLGMSEADEIYGRITDLIMSRSTNKKI